MNKNTTILLFLLLFFSETYSQGHFPVIAMEIIQTPVSGNVVNGQPDISDSTVFNIVMKVAISDTNSISKLNVILKSADNSTQVLSKQFDYDVAGTFSDGTSYSRNGYEVSLNLGNFMGMIRPEAELVVENLSGIITDPIIYQ